MQEPCRRYEQAFWRSTVKRGRPGTRPGHPKVEFFFAHAASAAVRDVPRNSKDTPPQDHMTTQKSNTSRSRAGGEQYFNPLIAMQEQVDDKAADQQSNTSRSQERGEQVEDKDADQKSNTSR